MQTPVIPQRMFKITPSDTAVFMAMGIRANSDGIVKFATMNPSEDVTISMIAGEILPVVVTKVYATGTTITSLHGFA